MICTSSGETVLLDDVLRYNQKAEGPLALTFRKLYSIGRSDTVTLIQEFYPKLMPYFIGCGTKNPVHHTAYVMEFMVTILIGEGKHNDVKVGMLAALFHDVAQGLSRLPKITEDHIKDRIRKVVHGNATLDELRQYRDDAVRARQEHMKDGARIAERMLTSHQHQHPEDLTDEEIREIERVIEHHDDPKIPVAYNVIRRMFDEDEECQKWQAELTDHQKTELVSLLGETGKEYLIKVKDWLLQYHHEADLLWMLTQDGIEADLARFSPVEEKTPRKMIDNNVSLHRQEVELYQDQPDSAAYCFQNGTVYRSETGFMIFEHLTQVLDERYPR
jgi:hypothetical protein